MSNPYANRVMSAFRLDSSRFLINITDWNGPTRGTNPNAQ